MKSRAHTFSMYLVAFAVAWLSFDVLVIAYGEAPWPILKVMFEGTWGTAYGVGQVLFKATPLLFTGIAVDLALRGGLFSIGAEGQVMMASLVVGAIGARLPVSTGPIVALPLLAGLAAMTGAVWGGLPGWLKVRFGAHEVISTIMMNRLAGGVLTYAFAQGLALKGTVRTASVIPAARITRLDGFIPAFRGSAASLALVVAMALAFAVTWAFRHIRAARELTLIGLAPKPCAAEHMPVAKRTVQAMALSGAVAGLASLATVLGYKGYFEEGLGAGAGFGGIAVALLARGNPWGLIAASVLFGTLQQGGLAVNAHVPMELMDVLSGVLVLAVALAGAIATSGVGALKFLSPSFKRGGQ